MQFDAKDAVSFLLHTSSGRGYSSVGRVFASLGWSPSAIAETCVVVHVCNSSTEEVEAGGLKVQDHPQLQIKFEVRMVYKGPGLKAGK